MDLRVIDNRGDVGEEEDGEEVEDDVDAISERYRKRERGVSLVQAGIEMDTGESIVHANLPHDANVPPAIRVAHEKRCQELITSSKLSIMHQGVRQ